MKKLLGLLLLAGSVYGATTSTPPGIQVEGTPSNNDVMVYSNGVLISSGVAPTNLVSVTNLTADIEANTETNNSQNTRLDTIESNGITSNSWAAASSLTQAVAVVIHPNGFIDPYTDFQASVEATTNNCAYILNQKVETDDNFCFIGDNINAQANGNMVIVTMDNNGTHGPGGAKDGASVWSSSAIKGTNITFQGWTVVGKYVSGFSTSAFPYLFVEAGNNSSSNRIVDCTFQLENYIDSVAGAAKVFVSVNTNYNTHVENCNIISYHDNRANERGTPIAVHDRVGGDRVQFFNCRFIATTNAAQFNASDAYFDLHNCKVNLSKYVQPGADGISHDLAMGFVAKGSANIFNPDESTSYNGETVGSYFDFDGTDDYINTGITPDINTKLIVEASITDAGGTQLIGAGSSRPVQFGFVSGSFNAYFGTESITGITGWEGRNVFRLDSTGFYINGVSKGSFTNPWASGSNDQDLMIGARGLSGNPANYATLDLYGFSVFDGSTLLYSMPKERPLSTNLVDFITYNTATNNGATWVE